MAKEPKTAEQIGRKLPDCGASHFGVCHREDGCAIEYTVCREQIRQEERTLIGETLCSFVGNLMLENMELGKLVGEKLKPMFDYLKEVNDG